MSSITPSPLTVLAPPSSVPSSSTGGGGNGGSMSLANSASLYLYTFLATLVLLLSVSGAIVIRSFVLRRRHRRMVEEAMRNGTWVPPTPPNRLPRVDLSKKPELWEAYLGGGGWQAGGLGHGSGKELGIGTDWNFEYSKDWESIKPISADYAMALSSVPYSDPTHNPTTLPTPIPNPGLTPVILLTPGDEENQRAAAISTTPSLFTRARTFLNPPLPAFPISASSPAASNGSNAHSTNISMTELNSNSPSTVKVTVLIAMPSLPSHSSSTPSSTFSSSVSQPTTSHPLHSSGIQPKPNDTHDEELPHLEMGVAEVVISPGNSSNWDAQRRERKTIYSRGSSYAE